MAYTKTTWTNGTTALSAINMNHLETGIADAHTTLDGLGTAAHADIGTSASTVAAGNHTHDSRYYTESEINALLATINAAVQALQRKDITHDVKIASLENRVTALENA